MLKPEIQSMFQVNCERLCHARDGFTVYVDCASAQKRIYRAETIGWRMRLSSINKNQMNFLINSKFLKSKSIEGTLDQREL